MAQLLGETSINAGKNKFVRMNHQIRVPMVRVFQDGKTLGVMPTRQALELAVQSELDLIEMVPNANPPVCHIMDYGKWKYEEKIKKKEEHLKNKAIAPKEIRLRPCTGDHDIETKVKMLRSFLEEKRNVRLIVKFDKREIAFKGQGETVLRKIIDAVSDLGKADTPLRMEGKCMAVNLVPIKKG